MPRTLSIKDHLPPNVDLTQMERKQDPRSFCKLNQIYLGERKFVNCRKSSIGGGFTMSSHLGLLMLLVRDISKTTAFYTEYLGLKLVSEFSNDEFKMLVSQNGQGTSLALQDATKETYGVPLAHGGIIPGFEVEDADAVYAAWKAKSVEILSTVADMGAGRTFTAKDPEGHYIQVFHLYPQFRETQKQSGM
jgi:predicted enzyme related to lactoylglutathione lyase